MKKHHLLLAVSLLSQFSFALAAEAPLTDVYHVKTMNKETAIEWCGGSTPLSGVEELPQEAKSRHRLPHSSHLYSKIYTGCACPKSQVLYKFGQKEKYCPTPKTQDEICLLVVDPLAPNATDLAGDMLKITSITIPSQLQPSKLNSAKPVAELEMIGSTLTLRPSSITPELKKKIIDELPKLDLTMCKWGCRNGITSDALIFNVKRINEAAKQLKKITGKNLKLNILTDNLAGADKDEILKRY